VFEGGGKRSRRSHIDPRNSACEVYCHERGGFLQELPKMPEASAKGRARL
jgi:hypothetical protein